MTDMTADQLESLAQTIADAIGTRELDDALAGLGVAVARALMQVPQEHRNVAIAAWISALMQLLAKEIRHESLN